MILAYSIYFFLLVILYTAAAHNHKLLLRSYKHSGNVKKTNDFWRCPLFLGFLLLILIVGLRYDVGVDYLGYYNDYLGINKGHNRWRIIERYEWGYETIIRFLLYFKMPAWVLFTIVAIFIWYFFIQSFKVFPFLLKWGFFFAFTTGFFFASMNGMRQTIAVTIFMYAIKYIEEKSISKYTLYIILASSFHTSILLIYPFYFFINKISFTHPKWVIIYVLTYIFGAKLYIRDIVVSALKLFPRYQYYTDSFLVDFANPLEIGLGNIYIFVVGLIIILLSRDLLNKIPRIKIYYNLFFIGSIWLNLSWRYAILGRVTYLFIWFKIFCLAALVYYFGKSKSKNYWVIYILVFTQLIVFFYKIFKSEVQCSPFQFIWY